MPVDAAFYSASLRLKEQLDIFLESKTYQRLNEIGLVQIGKVQLMLLWQQAAMPQVAEFRQYVESPEGQDAVALLKDMFSEEMFLYGSSDVAGAARDVHGTSTRCSRQARIEALAGGENAEEVVGSERSKVLAEHIEKFKIPTLVFGWRIEDGERAERQLDAVHSLVRNLLDEHRPELSPHLQRDQIGGHEFLTLRLDGSMIPWDEIREEAKRTTRKSSNGRSCVSDKTLAVALGVTDEFVLLSVGDSTDHLENFRPGQIAERAAAIGAAQQACGPARGFDWIHEQGAGSEIELAGADDGRPGRDWRKRFCEAAEVTEEQRRAVVADIRGLGSEVQKVSCPNRATSPVVSFLTSRGYEGIQYQARGTADVGQLASR